MSNLVYIYIYIYIYIKRKVYIYIVYLVYIYIYIYIYILSEDIIILLKTFSDMKSCFYHSGFLDYCFHLFYYFHNVSADVSSDRLQVFPIEPRSLFNLWGLIALISLTISGYMCYVFLYCYSPSFRIEPANSR